LCVRIFHLGVDILKNGADHANNCNNKRAEKNGAKVVPDQPPVASHNAEVTSLVCVCGKVPRGHSNNQNILGSRDEEGREPEEHEKTAPHHVLLLICPGE